MPLIRRVGHLFTRVQARYATHLGFRGFRDNRPAAWLRWIAASGFGHSIFLVLVLDRIGSICLSWLDQPSLPGNECPQVGIAAEIRRIVGSTVGNRESIHVKPFVVENRLRHRDVFEYEYEYEKSGKGCPRRLVWYSEPQEGEETSM